MFRLNKRGIGYALWYDLDKSGMIIIIEYIWPYLHNKKGRVSYSWPGEGKRLFTFAFRCLLLMLTCMYWHILAKSVLSSFKSKRVQSPFANSLRTPRALDPMKNAIR
jgi:hypothetical protein